MYTFYPYPHQSQQQFFPWLNQSYIPQTLVSFETQLNSQYPLPLSHSANPPLTYENKDPKSISDSELINLLEDRTNKLKRLHETDQQQQLPILLDVIVALRHAPKAILVSTAQKDFFALLRTPFTDILQRWRRFSSLPENESFIFRSTTKLIYRLIRSVDNISMIPLWLSDSTLLGIISDCLTDIATLKKFLDAKNKYQFKYFTHLIDAYTLYQIRFNDDKHFNKDMFIQLLHPILQCLTSNQYIHTFTNLSIDSNSMRTIEKFFLLTCTKFLTSYKGSHLEQTMRTLLPVMLPQYLKILDRFVPSAHSWNRAMLRSIEHLLRIINHGADHSPTNAKLISNYLPLISHILNLLNEPKFYNNLHPTLSNSETKLINTSISFLVNMINEPTILAHIKQSHVALSFLRLTSCQNETLLLNVYTLLAYTTHEDDMKSMKNSDRLLSTIVQSLKITLNGNSDQSTQMEQLLETLKGLVQHDQIKDEIIKQNALPFLLGCIAQLTGKAHVLIFEILWSLTFHDECAPALRSNKKFLEMIQSISNDSHNEGLKKAADGLVWKLIREPAFLEKIAKKEEEEKTAAKGVMETVIEEVVNSDGQKQLIQTIKPATNTTGERTFQYDIMISYCHADKELTYKIHKYLVSQGFKVWIDLDNMHGPAMSAMADAVENSEFIVMCMSDSYKQSTYCQAEAEYAFSCKRRLIPLIMRPKYKPDGWLGFMIGSRMYVDFGKFDFETGCQKLLTEISRQSKRPIPSKIKSENQNEQSNDIVPNKTKIITSHHNKPSIDNNDTNVLYIHTKRKPMSNFNRKPLYLWTESDVLDFLSLEHLIQLMPLCETMNGQALIQLYKMCTSQGTKMYILLNEELNSTFKLKLPIGVFTKFLSSIEQRLNTGPLVRSETKIQYPETKSTKISQEHLSYSPSTPTANYNPSKYPLQSDNAYDLLITSDVPAIQVLRTVERYGINFAKKAFASKVHFR
ncbi:unnamed protein product [Adineta steineri]|uniref:TIR domain-containing protein n=1 Tax=Adineta steineri TaxID=433720 RepID=A0A818VV58_9BILA|nr:unnamed protein product [Adineta steineri]